ncbi:ATP-dependent 6-phosphofructokinase [Fluviispira sanaruensis]|uniref:Diphosphate--fructose-6-phosphate 1-phosphotransferase n=1 Tax=Fluviispira sanaruensis TaxID=2493639 RepID=A0A4P2VT90_FLUSA|nr:ATP-dependent 6-phosphofructokinase [Fluviispira sanaruensis]BBH52092.1 diphosphate--fructose-6-phosphate 1-phosphotransferase [Fluviispira sanaruensis]
METIEIKPEIFLIESLTETFGQATLPSPLKNSFQTGNFVEDGKDRVLVDISLEGLLKASRPDSGKIVFQPPTFELAGPREKIFWNPENTKVAIVTCGGLAPGLNNVIQNLVTFLSDRYRVKNIYGVPYGYQGFSHDPQTKRFAFGWRRLDPFSVQNIDFEGGSVLGTGRGHSNHVAIVDALMLRDINILFTIGGDGTLAGANAIHEEIKRRKVPITLIGIPKTIDNDVLWVSKTFGFESAVGKAVEALRCAQTEARSAFHGIGLVKIMGRNCGALTATAAVAMNDIDFVLVPEVPIKLEGPNGLLNTIVKKVIDKGYITIAVAEGAGQDLFPPSETEKDASGNIKLKDIGKFLQKKIVDEFKTRNIETTLKYIDPSYMLRSQTTSADDSVFCAKLGQNAVHAAMAGKTGCMIGYAHERFTHVPLAAVAVGKKRLDTNESIWLSVLASTGQPAHWE